MPTVSIADIAEAHLQEIMQKINSHGLIKINRSGAIEFLYNSYKLDHPEGRTLVL